MDTVGVIGLGIMGLRCAQKLAEKGIDVCGFDLFPAAVERARQAGITTCASPAAVAEKAQFVLLFVPGPVETEQVVLGPNGLQHGAQTGSIIVNMSTVDPDSNIRMGECLLSSGVGFVDAPVMGNPSGVGSWGFAVGGKDADVAAIRFILLALGGSDDKIFHIGPLGHGNKLKLLNNMMLGAINACAAETLALAARMGVSQKTLIDVAVAAKARVLSSAYQEVATRAANNAYEAPTFTVSMLAKDNRLCLEMARAHNAPLILGTAVDTLNSFALAQGFGALDHSVMWEVVSKNWEK